MASPFAAWYSLAMQGSGGLPGKAVWTAAVACLFFACGDSNDGGSSGDDSGAGGGGEAGESSTGGRSGRGGSGGTGAAGTAGENGESGDAGAGAEAGSGANAGGGAGGSVGGTGGHDGGASGDGGGGSAGRPITTTETCAAREDETRWDAGRTLYIDDDEDCDGLAPCYATIGEGVAAATSGDTVAVFPGAYVGTNVRQDADLSSLRIMALEGPAVTAISFPCMKVYGEEHDPGQVWIDGFTFHNCGATGSLTDLGWGVYVTSLSDVEVRIQDNAFEGDFGRGGVGLQSSFVGTRLHAVVARNRFSDHHGAESALDIDLPADFDEDYCVRVENNVITASSSAINIHYPRFQDGAGRFEIANNTLYDNALGFILSRPSGVYTFVNNILFENTEDFSRFDETSERFDMRNNLFGSGQFTGLNGNFAADPVFMDAEAGNFRLQGASPAADRGDVRGTALEDITGTPRTDPPDLGAYERTEPAGEPLDGFRCGDGLVHHGIVGTSGEPVLGFETCDDGNAESGDGCSSLCQFEPAPARNQIALRDAHLCVIRENGSLSCWNGDEEALPTGSFRELALSALHGCALRDDGTVSCWRKPGPSTSFAPTGTFTQIEGDHYDTCGLRDDGSITCWDEQAITLEQAGPYARVDADQRVCGLSAAGEPTCYAPYTAFPSGPFLQLFPSSNNDGCGFRPSGELVCIEPGVFFLDVTPLAGFAQVSVYDQGMACGLRPDGRALFWTGGGALFLVQDEAFLEVAAGFSFCCGLTLDRRASCTQNSYGLPAE
jgi:cysteine-rich repeat protein